jgi:hypothetical protein
MTTSTLFHRLGKSVKTACLLLAGAALCAVFVAAPGRAAEGGITVVFGEEGGNAILDFVSDEELNPLADKAKIKKDYGITRDLTADEKREIGLAVAYWDQRIGNTPAGSAIIYAGFVDVPGKSAFSLSPAGYLIDEITKDISPNGTVFDKFIHGRESPYPAGLADNIIIFNVDFGTDVPTRLLLHDGTMATMLHELGHALGIMGWHEVTNPDPITGVGTEGKFYPESFFTAWNNHLQRHIPDFRAGWRYLQPQISDIPRPER